MKRKLIQAKLISMATIIVMLLASLNGCQSTTNESSGASKTETGKKTTITLATYEVDTSGAMRKIIAEFEEKNPDIKIECELGGGDQYETSMKAKLSTGQAADIIGTHPGVNQIGQYAKAGYLQELTGGSFLDNISDGILNQVSYEDKVYGVPLSTLYTGVFYNKDIFDNLGIKIPKTWNEFLEVCKTLKSNSITPISLGLKDSWVGQVPVYAFTPTTIYKENINFDADMYDGKAKFNGPEWKGTVEKLLSLKEYLVEGYMSLGYDQMMAEFSQGKAAMIIGFTPMIPMIEADADSKLNYGLFIMPTSDDGNNWCGASVGAVLSLNKESKNKEAATKFFEYYMSDDVYRGYVEKELTLPVKTDFNFNGNQIVVDYAKQIDGTYGFLDAYWSKGVQDVFIKGIQEMFIGENIDTVLTSLDNEFERRVGK